MRQLSLRYFTAWSLSLPSSKSSSRPLLRALIPCPNCCCTASTLLSRARVPSATAAEISGFSLGACSNGQFSGTRNSFISLSLVSLLRPFLRMGDQSRERFSCIFGPYFGVSSVVSPKAERVSGSNCGTSSSRCSTLSSIVVGLCSSTAVFALTAPILLFSKKDNNGLMLKVEERKKINKDK